MERKIIAHGIDISAHQGRVNWKKVANWRGNYGEKVDFALLRAGYGRGNQSIAEPYIHQHIEEAAAEGIGIGIGLYWFCYATNAEEAKQEARELIAIANQHKGKITFPLVYDLEYDSDDYAVKQGRPLNRRIRTDMIKAFCEECERAGYFSMFYTNEDYLQTKLYEDELIGRYDLWQAAPFARGSLHNLNIANDGTVNAYVRSNANIWQYYWWGEIPGINGVADLNLAFRDYPKIISEVGLNYLKPNVPVIEPEPVYKLVLKTKDRAEAERILSILKEANLIKA
ncbi:MAG: GH25 family lysozyme [Eubacteriales bacterium]|nr:GH25 family lysozyme [Eubacteriales bacterium]